MIQMPAGQLCQNCNKRPATIRWVGEAGYLAVTRSYMQSWWCERCVTDYQYKYAREQAGRVSALRKQLETLIMADKECPSCIADIPPHRNCILR